MRVLFFNGVQNGLESTAIKKISPKHEMHTNLFHVVNNVSVSLFKKNNKKKHPKLRMQVGMQDIFVKQIRSCEVSAILVCYESNGVLNNLKETQQLGYKLSIYGIAPLWWEIHVDGGNCP